MRNVISTIVHWVSWLAAILAVLATAEWVMIVADGNYCWSTFAFTMMAIPLGGGMLLLGVAPSAGLYLKNHRPRDLTSLKFAGCSLALILIEAAVLWIMPQRGE